MKRRRCGICGDELPWRPRGRPRKWCSDKCKAAARRRRRRPARVRPTGVSRNDWSTPAELFRALDEEFRFDLDACASAGNALCPRYFTASEDGLAQPWAGRVFMNPPYGRSLSEWVRKAHEEALAGRAAVVVCLLPARTDSGWWHDYALRGEVRFIRGRLRFGEATKPAPFPSVVVVFSRNPKTARHALSSPATRAESRGVDIRRGPIKDQPAYRQTPRRRRDAPGPAPRRRILDA